MRYKKKEIGIIGVISNPPKKTTSHNAGWTYFHKSFINHKGYDCRILTEKDDWNEFDILYLNEGLNYKEGIYNVFGGINNKILIRLDKLNSFKGKIITYGDKIDYNDFCKKRNINKEINININYEKPNSLSKKLILGDSHALSVYKEGYSLSRNDGKTLYGFLKEGIKNYIPEMTSELIFYAGNIDVRHHLYREKNSLASALRMINGLALQLRSLKVSKISLVELLPVENESRKIPRTGYYKGTPFFGSWEERSLIKDFINQGLKKICKNHNYKYLSWPKEYSNNKGELKFEIMEGSSSVHIAPHSYMFKDSFIDNKQLNLF